MAGAHVLDPYPHLGQGAVAVNRFNFKLSRVLQALDRHLILMHQTPGLFLVVGLFRSLRTEVIQQIVGTVEVMPVIFAFRFDQRIRSFHKGLGADHVTILTVNIILSIKAVLPLMIGGFNREVLVVMKDLVTRSAEISLGMELRLPAFMKTVTAALRWRVRAMLDQNGAVRAILPRLNHKRTVSRLFCGGFTMIDGTDRMAHITGNTGPGHWRQTADSRPLDLAGNNAGRGVAAFALARDTMSHRFGRLVQFTLINRIDEGHAVQGTVPLLIFVFVAFAAGLWVGKFGG